ncbi:hypothetical protein ABID59_001105 [Bradyrhizobium sp. S3.3.6]|uniref:AbiU2 domain-containing protein n=1 Tax=Bradyrhizobium sp. S3.3.6 TaxID=3156429 RepID=UPI003396F861
MTTSTNDSSRSALPDERPRIDRVTFFNIDNKTAFQIHTVPVGADSEKYARAFVERETREGRLTRSYLIERDSGRMRASMADQTADEAKKANIQKMGEQLGTLFSGLWQEVATLHFHWNEYVTLFGTKPERITLLNQAAPFFFRVIQDTLWESTLLSLARLTDPSNSQGNPDRSNLTVQALPALIADERLREKVERLVREATKLTEFCRDWRNRRIAHRDLKLALNEFTKPLAEGSRANVKDALKATAEVLNAVQLHYCDSGTGYDLGGPLGGANSLLYVLDDGLRAEEARQKRLEEGKPLANDFEARDL